jgi:uncharacterized membrane protein
MVGVFSPLPISQMKAALFHLLVTAYLIYLQLPTIAEGCLFCLQLKDAGVCDD